MAEPFLSEIRIMSFNFPPKGWAMCNGQFLPINQNQALFALLGTTFGGNGQTTFALPDLRGRTPIHVGSGHTLGERAGEQAHTLTINELPQHSHVLNAKSVVSTTSIPNIPPPPAAAPFFSNSAPSTVYTTDSSSLTAMNAAAITNVGGSQAHENRQPFLILSFCIALQGIFPSPN